MFVKGIICRGECKHRLHHEGEIKGATHSMVKVADCRNLKN